jgi:hypothetical protein
VAQGDHAREGGADLLAVAEQVEHHEHDEQGLDEGPEHAADDRHGAGGGAEAAELGDDLGAGLLEVDVLAEPLDRSGRCRASRG